MDPFLVEFSHTPPPLRDEPSSTEPEGSSDSPVDETPSEPSSPRHRSSSLEPPEHINTPALSGTKRPAEDMTQFVTETARKVRLRAEGSSQLVQFSKMDVAEQNIVINANLLKIIERQDELQPPDEVYKIPKAMASYIDNESFYVIVLPSLSAYIEKDEPLNIIIGKLVEKAMWGFPALRQDANKMDVIEERIRNKLNSRRYNLKKAIFESLSKVVAAADNGTVNVQDPASSDGELGVPSEAPSKGNDIIKLCGAIHGKAYPFRGNSTDTVQMAPSLEMTARIAFLRRCFVRFEAEVKGKDPAKQSFWQYVDWQLDGARKVHKNDQAKLSGMFWAVLSKDRELYKTI